MAAFVETLRTGAWLTRERIRLWALAVLAASAVGLVFLIVTANGLNDFRGEPLGTDYSNVYAAGTYVLDGRAAAAFDWLSQHKREQEIFGEKTPFFGWHYPPFFLFIAGALATMPYLVSLAVWQAVTLLLYLLCIRVILRDYGPPPGELRSPTSPLQGEVRTGWWLLLALAFPAVFVNIGHGHNGFLTATLLGGALVLMDRKPVIAGVLIGLVAYKPQFGLLIPLALIAGGRWRVFFAAGATVAALVLATTIAFGPDVWRAFLDSMTLTRVEVLEQGGTGWHKIQSVFSVVRMWGGSVPLAYAAQGAVTVAAAAALCWLWRSQASHALKAAALCIAVILATPYSLDYDLVVLAPAIAFMAMHGLTHGFGPWEKTALALLWIAPLAARPLAQYTLIPLGVPLMLLVFALTVRRALADLDLLPRWQTAVHPVK